MKKLVIRLTKGVELVIDLEEIEAPGHPEAKESSEAEITPEEFWKALAAL